MPKTIYHIVLPDHWQSFAEQAFYTPPTFEQEGFIHLSKKHQIEGVLSRYYVGVERVILLHLDEEKLGESLVYEPSTNGEMYPHLYGLLPKSAILEVQDLIPADYADLR
jgi:uncharacterized protein (DUF952 family)